jgi:hypothetical protein
MNENATSMKRKILHEIDSVYASTHSSKLKKIINSSCLGDTIIEVKVLNSLSIYDLFYFNKDIHLIEVKHKLKEVY